MAKAPILRRTVLFTRVRRSGSALYRLSDWSTVDTELGQMWEPRTVSVDNGSITQRDINDAEFDEIRQFDEEKMASEYCHGGLQLPVDFGV